MKPLLTVCFILSLVGCAGSQNKPVVRDAVVEPEILQPVEEVINILPFIELGYRCSDTSKYKRRVIGTGECVALVQHCSDIPLTRYWRPGPQVKGLNLVPGTIIATFRKGRYPNRRGWHVAVYIEQNEKGIWVWDQWRGQSVHRRLIRFNNPPVTSNNGDDYRVVVTI